eukprot:TRINITY_DN48_c0_g1_i1.p1 TRINITY_DN48_c0_g1~~TRINITY_DN48_c0_g1_i1.p1  ORF type:complete len:1280 (-),score=427.38 TRINITY_DN48_c0_g1_i1:235-4074(-)
MAGKEAKYTFANPSGDDEGQGQSPKKERKKDRKAKKSEIEKEEENSSEDEAKLEVTVAPILSKEEQKKADKRKKKEDAKRAKEEQVSLTQLFRHADKIDALLLIFGSIGAIGQGLLFPIFSLVFGELLDAFNGTTREEIYDKVVDLCYWFLIIGAGGFLSAFLQNTFWSITAERQARQIRESYLRAIYRQEIGWFDKIGTGELTSRISGDTIVVQEGIEKCGSFFQFFSQFIAGFVIAFIRGWKLTLVLLAITPLTAISGFFVMKVMADFATRGQAAYANAGTVATEVISGIRTVTSFGAQRKESVRYKKNLIEAMNIGIKRSTLSGVGIGIMMFVIYIMYAVALGYGAKLVIDGEYTGGKVLTVLFAVMMGGFALGQAGPSGEALNKGRGAAYKMFNTISRVPEINSESPDGRKLESVKGNIVLKNVKFHYPTRPEAKVMRGINIKIKAGRTTALVGPSGCGKSSTIQLVQRFYDPTDGEIFLDDVPLKELNVKWLRKQIGVVGQEPVLFMGTIADNIRYGKPNATREEVEEAAKASNAHNFIMEFPDKYDTQVGEKGAQLSGGQKQRIAIARAIIKDPSVLLLDEATSALDNESEKIVQEALDSVMKGRTTIVVAHRLSTIRNADHIVVINKGKVREQGTHDELIKKNGLYSKLVSLQALGVDTKEKKKEKKKDEDVTKKAEVEKKVIAQKEAEVVKQHPVSIKRLFGLNRPEFGYIALGVLGTMINGASQPVFSIVFSEMVDLYYQPVAQIKKDAGMWAGIFIAMGAGPLIGNALSSSMFGQSSERFIRRIREMAFNSIIRQEISYFDSEKHSTGILTSHLASEATLVGQLVGINFALTVQNIWTLITGLVIAFYYGWKLTLVVLAASPLMAFGQAMQAFTMKNFTQKTQEAYSKANEVATESIANMRTVASFTQEQQCLYKYSERLEEPMQLGSRRALTSGIATAFGVFSILGVYAISFWYGGKLIRDGEYEFIDVLKVFMAIAMSTMGIGQSAAFFPDAAKAKAASSMIFQIIDRKSAIDPENESGVEPQVTGTIEFKDVTFHYPQRPDTQIFTGLNFSVPKGKVIALVGQSGAGKSSVIALLERFYDPTGGQILIDGVPLEDYNIKYIRRQLSLVGQEPVLFAGTIADNIRYGKPDATMDEIIAATKASNAHNFIEGFPDKYDTQVGEKGAQLSGGQKQRIAIARAIIKDPKILLLDEATSALDTESEKVVQDALDSVMKGRTTVVIAHRLSTIRHADIIAVIESGKVVESGTHEELLAKEGAYYGLVHGRRV